MENVETIVEEKVKKAPFYSYRGIGKCFSDGVSFITDNFIFFLKVFSPVCVVGGFFTALFLYNYSMVFAGIHIFIVDICFNVALAMVLRLFIQDSLEKGFLGFNTISLLKASRKQIIKSLVFFVLECIILIVCFLPTIIACLTMMQAEHFLVLMGIYMLNIVVFFFVVFIPLNLANIYAVMEKGKIIKNAWIGFKKGYKYWGKSFGLVLILTITFFIVCLMICMPVGVIFCVKKAEMESIAIGESANIPLYFDYISFIVSMLTCAIMLFFTLIFVTSFAYLYASVKVDEKESVSTLKIDEIV